MWDKYKNLAQWCQIFCRSGDQSTFSMRMQILVEKDEQLWLSPVYFASPAVNAAKAITQSIAAFLYILVYASGDMAVIRNG